MEKPHFISLLVISILMNTIQMQHFAKLAILWNTDIQLTNYMSVYKKSTEIACAALCVEENVCIIASFSSPNCYLHNNFSTPIEAYGMVHYLKKEDKTGSIQITKDVMSGARSWQSSTFDDIFYAGSDLALDGNTDSVYFQRSCAATNNYYSYWAMEFGTAGIVASVDIYLRSDYYERNTNRIVKISQTEADANNNEGILCGGYYGPLITTEPFIMTIKCTRPIYGKFMRITYDAPDIMEICEVVVHTI